MQIAPVNNIRDHGPKRLVDQYRPTLSVTNMTCGPLASDRSRGFTGHAFRVVPYHQS
jgi:hypothetical protein